MTDTATMAPASGNPVLPRLLRPGPVSAGLARHLELHGAVPYRGVPHDLIDEIRTAGLTGRGGAGFPTAVKMSAVAEGSTRTRRAGRAGPVVVANGAEGEPASNKDKHLLWSAPHLVLDGLQLAAETVGARRAFLYAHGHDPLLRVLSEAMAERSTARSDRVAVRLVAAPPRFLAGEESALASHVGGGPAMPTFKQPRIFERGVGGAPTLEQNVETLAHIALIARHGATWFRQAGTAAEPGTMLVTRDRADGTVEVAEVAIGTALADVVGLDPDGQPAQAVLTGGYHGTWLAASQAARLPLTNAALRQAGASLGAGVLTALPHGRCGLVETAHVVRYLAAESAGQCGPCRHGLPRIADEFAALSRLRPDPTGLARLKRWTGLVAGRGACHHPDGTVRLVRSALSVFSAEIARHQQGMCIAAGSSRRAPFLRVPAFAPGPRDWR